MAKTPVFQPDRDRMRAYYRDLTSKGIPHRQAVDSTRLAFRPLHGVLRSKTAREAFEAALKYATTAQ